MNKRSWYLLKNLLIILALGSMLLVFFKGISIFDDGSEKGTLDGQGIEAQKEKKRIQAEKLFLEGQKLLEKAKDENDVKVGLGMIYQSISLFNEMNNKDGTRNAIKYLANHLKTKGDRLLFKRKAAEALGIFRETLDFYKKIRAKNDEADTLIKIGNIYSNLGQYDKALKHHKEALAIHKKIGNKQGEGNALRNIGNVYRHLGQNQKALDYYEQALAIHTKIGDKKGEGYDLIGIGYIYSYLWQYQKALDYYEKALPIHKQIGDKEGEGSALTNIGNAYGHLGQYQKALDYYEHALAIFKQIGNKRGEGMVLTNIGSVYTDLEQHEEALISLRQALAINENIGIPTYVIDGNIVDILLAQGNIKEASRIFKKLKHPIGMGRLSLVKKEYSDALAYFQKSLKLDVTKKLPITFL